jgi:CheY-like chemotaxis protein
MEPSTDATRIRVVIVDDSEDVRYLLGTVMEVDGRFEVVAEAHDAAEALLLVPRQAPDLVLVDLHLDGHDGNWLIRELRQRAVGAVLALVTASSRPEEHAAAIAAGADAVHNKMSMTSTMMDELADLVGARV